jgi:hypothetical protein
MPRHERAPNEVPAPSGDGPRQVRFRRDADGRLVILRPPSPKVATTEAAERPPTPGDPRSGPLRDAPPFGAA